MKPRTKFQKQVAEQSKRLAKITRKQQDWAFQNCFEMQARRLKNGTLTCLECGHSWKGGHALAESVCGCTCPHCGTSLTVIDSRKQSFKQADYYGIYTVCGGFQVLRYFFLEKHCQVGNLARLHWRDIALYEKYRTFALYKKTNNYGSHRISFGCAERTDNHSRTVSGENKIARAGHSVVRRQCTPRKKKQTVFGNEIANKRFHL